MNVQGLYERLNRLTVPYKCSKCGKVIDVPNIPTRELETFEPYCATKTLLACAWLICHGWHILDDGIGGRRPFFCPDCWDGSKPQLKELGPYRELVRQGEEWVRNKKNQETRNEQG